METKTISLLANQNLPRCLSHDCDSCLQIVSPKNILVEINKKWNVCTLLKGAYQVLLVNSVSSKF